MHFNGVQEFDQHIENLRSQLRFLNETLEATDHNTPDWLATDLISLRNKSGRLQDDMQRFRDQLEREGLGKRTVNSVSLSPSPALRKGEIIIPFLGRIFRQELRRSRNQISD